jgi:drug/metabolite transporter (DMT)-like permease
MSSRLPASTIALLLAPPLFWAGNAVTARALVGDVPPLALSFGRWALAFVLIAPFATRASWQHRAALRANAGMLLLLSLLGIGCYNSLLYLALQTSSALNATLINAPGPIITLMMGAAFFSAGPITRPQWIGALLSASGVLLVITRGDPERLLALQFGSGDLIMLAATVLWSLYTWLLRTRRPKLPFTVFLAVQIGLGTLMILPFALLEFFITGQTASPTPSNLAALVYVALFPSLAAYYCWDRGVSEAGAVVPTYFVNLTPVFTGLLSWLLLAEPISAYHLVGFALILGGIQLSSRSSLAAR